MVLLLLFRAKNLYDIDQILLASGALLVLALMVNFLLRRDAKGSNALAISMLWSSFIICMAGIWG